jgi:TRAP-type C4-dicarboxylate transport system substrate-binding protein
LVHGQDTLAVEFGAVAELQLLDLFLERALSHGDLWTPEFDYIQRPIRPKAADWHGLQASTNMPGLRAEAITTQGGILMKTTAMLAAALALATYAAEAQEVTLKAVTSFAEKTQFSKNFERFIDKVNADGKGQVQINYIGGPRAMPPFEVGNAVRTKVVDIANVTGAFYTNLMPEADGFKLVSKPQSEQRKDGTFAFINELHNQKLNSFYLARQFHNVPFHIYMNKKIDKLDFTGLKIRVTPVYKDIVEALGGTTVTTAPGEVYTALERGVVDGYGWPVTGIFDLGWEKVTKFRMEPAFYSVEVDVLVNLDVWKGLNDAQKKVLNDAALGSKASTARTTR